MLRQVLDVEPAHPRESQDELWYPKVRYLQTKQAAETARCIADWIGSVGDPADRPAEERLFAAMHTCAYRARQTRTNRLGPAMRAKWARRWRRIRNYLVNENLGLVYSTLQRSSVKNADDDELQSDAFLALLHAVHRFDPWRGYRFSSYAVSAIHHALIYRSKYENRHRRLFPVTFDTALEHAPRTDENGDIYVERLRRALERNLGALTELESRILAERFPADDRRRRTLRELSTAIGMSKERVRQIQQRALSKLREVLHADPVLQ